MKIKMRLRKGKKVYMTTLMIKGKMKLKIMTIIGKKLYVTKGKYKKRKKVIYGNPDDEEE